MITLNELTRSLIRLSWTLEAVIDTALCVGAGGSTGSLSDKPIIRNAQGQLLIPGSQLKGRLRHECEKLARSLGWWIPDSPLAEKLYLPDESNEIPEAFREPYSVPGYPGSYHCWISQIFGDPILPSRIIVDDLICPYSKDELPEVLRPGVSINRARRTAEDQKLFYLETSPAGAGLPFQGQIHLLHDCPPHAELLLLVAIAHIQALGGGKSGGLGWLHWRQRPTLTDEEQSSIAWSSLMPPTQP
ncbi:MAG: RAMP superfamily CRISPR-associated protein [Stenomitos frigidus ULC029]